MNRYYYSMVPITDEKLMYTQKFVFPLVVLGDQGEGDKCIK